MMPRKVRGNTGPNQDLTGEVDRAPMNRPDPLTLNDIDEADKDLEIKTGPIKLIQVQI